MALTALLAVWKMSYPHTKINTDCWTYCRSYQTILGTVKYPKRTKKESKSLHQQLATICDLDLRHSFVLIWTLQRFLRNNKNHLTGTRSGYFLRIFSPSARRFSNGCSSLYCHFIVYTDFVPATKHKDDESQLLSAERLKMASDALLM